MDKRQDTLRKHSFDGIQEFDNRLPNWWLWILYGSIVFSVIYWVLFHTLAVIPHPTGRYQADMRAAEEARLERAAAGGVTNESLTLMSQMADQVAEGRQHFVTYCVVCHLDQGQGSVGPNLTDEFWLHGGAPMDILETVMDGVPAKGMAAWGGQLGPRRVEQAVAFLLTIRDTQVAGKPPEGERYVPGDHQPDDVNVGVEDETQDATATVPADEAEVETTAPGAPAPES